MWTQTEWLGVGWQLTEETRGPVIEVIRNAERAKPSNRGHCRNSPWGGGWDDPPPPALCQQSGADVFLAESQAAEKDILESRLRVRNDAISLGLPSPAGKQERGEKDAEVERTPPPPSPLKGLSQGSHGSHLLIRAGVWRGCLGQEIRPGQGCPHQPCSASLIHTSSEALSHSAPAASTCTTAPPLPTTPTDGLSPGRLCPVQLKRPGWEVPLRPSKPSPYLTGRETNLKSDLKRS